MESDASVAKQQGPPSRRSRVHGTQIKIQAIEEQANENAMGSATKKSKKLDDVCDVDDKMTEVIHWSKEEAKRFVEKWTKLASRKSEAKNEEAFIKEYVLPDVSKEWEMCEQEMKDALRFKRYNIQVHEDIQVKDQATLAKYILLLEYKINKKMLEKNALRVEVTHLRSESEMMRFTTNEIRTNDDDGSSRNFASSQSRGGKAIADEAVAIADEAPGDGEESSRSSDEEVNESQGAQAGEAPRSDNPNAITNARPLDAKATQKLSDALTSHLGKR